MTISVLEALIVVAAGVLAVAYPLAGTNGLRVASIIGGILAIVVGVLWLIHAGA